MRIGIIFLMSVAVYLGCSTSAPQKTPASQAKSKALDDPEASRALFSSFAVRGLLSGNEFPAVRKAASVFAAEHCPNCQVVGVGSTYGCQGTYLSGVDLLCNEHNAEKRLTVDLTVRSFVDTKGALYWKADEWTEQQQHLLAACMEGEVAKRQRAE